MGAEIDILDLHKSGDRIKIPESVYILKFVTEKGRKILQ